MEDTMEGIELKRVERSERKCHVLKDGEYEEREAAETQAKRELEGW
jgi:hypothetical protein